jgi:putative PIN family toxin of toxin-antitoxin system
MVFVFDTNVLISAAMGEGTARKAFDLARAHGQLVKSDETLAELASTLEKPKLQKFLQNVDKVELIATFINLTKTSDVTERIVACRDAEDDMWLELAVAAKAEVVISGDKGLLALHPFRGIPILNPADFLSWLLSKQV